MRMALVSTVKSRVTPLLDVSKRGDRCGHEAKPNWTPGLKLVLAYGSLPNCTKTCDIRCYAETAGGAKVAAQIRCPTKNCAAGQGMIQSRT